MNCRDALPLMHEYFDGGLKDEEAYELRTHMNACPGCERRFRSYERTEALVRSLDRPEARPDLTASVMAALPPAARSRSWARWVRRHPAATAAAAFLIIMISSFLSLWNQGTQLTVRGDDPEGIVIEDGKVIVPKDARIRGDLVVENGTVQIDGELEGNLTVIDGKVLYASTAHISGRVIQVDRALDYIWFRLSEWFSFMLPAPQT